MRPRKALLVAASVVVMGGMLVVPALANWSFWPGDVAQVAGTGGEGINVRSAPGVSAGVVSTLPEAFAVTILDGPIWLDDGTSWYEIGADTVSGWFTGWVTSAYLGTMGSADVAVAGVSFSGPPPTPSDVASGVPLWVHTGNGSLNIRSAPGTWADVIGSAPDGSYIEILDVAVWDDAGGSWTLVNYYGTVGYVASAYLGQSISFGTATGGGSVQLASSHPLTIGATAWTTEGVNLRHPPGTDGGIISTIMAGNAVTLIDGPVWDANDAPWYQVQFDGLTGWIIGEYLSAGSSGGTNVASTGSAIVYAAMQYQGVPYVWGGTTPDGFDCSGFTWYILSEVMGYNYPRPMEDQVVSGYYVSAAELMPGDVVYFQNTYQWGLSHMGFYIGDGQFVHAGSESMGVGVGSLYDPYWQSRYVTARRVN